ncbi:MAG: DNA repair protein RecO [Oscillospiraceae bacterium]
MLMKTCGIVVKAQKINAEKKLIWILTKDQGIIKAFCKDGGRRTGGFAATEILCFSNFVLFKSKDTFSVNSAEAKEPFLHIRNNLENLALASYFCQTLIITIPQQIEGTPEPLKLTYLLLRVLNAELNNILKIKAIFELKLAKLLGFAPDLNNSAGGLEFYIKTGNLSQTPGLYSIKLSSKVAEAIKFIINTPIKKSLTLELSQTDIKFLTELTEGYLLDKIEYHINTLDYFWGIYNQTTKEQGA